MANYAAIFSPTGGTGRVAEILMTELEEPWQQIDLCRGVEEKTLTAEDLLLAAVPSYGGRVPGAAVERLKQLHGSGAKAVLVCVYGNREWEDTLTELQDTLEGCGFVCDEYVRTVAPRICLAIDAAAEDLDEVTALDFVCEPFDGEHIYNRTIKDGPVDRMVRGFTFRRAEHAPIAAVSAACHGVFRGRVTAVSADFAGEICRLLDAQGMQHPLLRVTDDPLIMCSHKASSS